MKYVSIPAKKCLAQRENSSLPVTSPVFRYTLADLKDIQEPFSGYTYMESTDAFYNTTSDYSPGYFTCTSGSIDAFGEYVQLFG